MEDRGKDDPLLEYINYYIQRTYRIKGEKWQKLMTSDDRVNNYFVSNDGYPWISLCTFFYHFLNGTLEYCTRLAQ